MEQEKKKRDYGMPLLLVGTAAVGLYLCLFSLIDYRATLRNPMVALMLGVLLLSVLINLILGLLDFRRTRKWKALLPLLVSILFIILVPLSGRLGEKIQQRGDEKTIARYSAVINRLLPEGGNTAAGLPFGPEAEGLLAMPVGAEIFIQGSGAVYYEAGGSLGQWLMPIAGGANTKEVTLKKTGSDEWALDASVLDPATGEMSRLEFGLWEITGDRGRVLLRSVKINGEAVDRMGRKAFLTRIATMAGLEVH